MAHYSVLNPSAARETAGPDGRDYGLIARRAAQRGMGIVAMRVLEAGVLSGSPRASVAIPPPDGTPTWREYEAQRGPSESLRSALEQAGGTMAQAAIRFVLSEEV